MWGYGGNFVVLLPNGVSAFRFADGNTHDLETMILAGAALRPCTSQTRLVEGVAEVLKAAPSAVGGKIARLGRATCGIVVIGEAPLKGIMLCMVPT
jgi:hypothetical protein